MSQHRRSTSSGQDSAVHLHLKEKGHSFDDSNVRILDREDRWFERGVKEAIYVHLEKPSLNRGGGLRHHLSATYNAVLGALPRRINPHSHLGTMWVVTTHIVSTNEVLLGFHKHVPFVGIVGSLGVKYLASHTGPQN